MNFIISFPRSGHHLVESIIEYLSSQFNLDFSYCDYYNCCKSIPCKHSSLFQKNHDFWLNPFESDFDLSKLQIEESSKYLVLYRKDSIRQLESYYRYYVNWSKSSYNYLEMINFIKNNLKYYNNFVNKWVNSADDKLIVVEYYELIEDFNNESKRIIKHFYNKDLDFDLKDITFEVKSGYKNIKHNSPIKLRNELDESLYNKIKSDLDL